jgi:N-acyl homoserine lactone hydrolase
MVFANGARTMYELDILLQGYPGRSKYHGGLGWSTIALLRGNGHTVLLDTGHYMHRDVLGKKLEELGVGFDDVDAVLLSHAHWDHCINFPLFRRAEIFISGVELDWAQQQPVGKYPIAELHVEKLLTMKNVRRIADGDECLPGIVAIGTPGHTPGHMAYVATGKKGEYIYTGDAIKNAAELCSRRVEMTLDEKASLQAVRRVRERAAANPENVVIFGHDRCCGFDGQRVHEREPLRFGLTARFGEDFDDITEFDLSRPAVKA